MATRSRILAWRIPMDRGAWRATVLRVTKSWTQLKRLSTHEWNIYNQLTLDPIQLKDIRAKPEVFLKKELLFKTVHINLILTEYVSWIIQSTYHESRQSFAWNTFGLKIQLAHTIEYIPEYDPTLKTLYLGSHTHSLQGDPTSHTVHLGTYNHSLQSDLLLTLPRVHMSTSPGWPPPDPVPGVPCPQSVGWHPSQTLNLGSHVLELQGEAPFLAPAPGGHPSTSSKVTLIPDPVPGVTCSQSLRWPHLTRACLNFCWPLDFTFTSPRDHVNQFLKLSLSIHTHTRLCGYSSLQDPDWYREHCSVSLHVLACIFPAFLSLISGDQPGHGLWAAVMVSYVIQATEESGCLLLPHPWLGGPWKVCTHILITYLGHWRRQYNQYWTTR